MSIVTISGESSAPNSQEFHTRFLPADLRR
jgi:hypothetical protein